MVEIVKNCYSTVWVDFQNSTRRGGTDFFSPPRIHLLLGSTSHRRRFFAHRNSTATPPRSLRETAQLPVWKRDGRNTIANGYTDNACDVRMIDRCICLKVANKYYNNKKKKKEW